MKMTRRPMRGKNRLVVSFVLPQHWTGTTFRADAAAIKRVLRRIIRTADLRNFDDAPPTMRRDLGDKLRITIQSNREYYPL